MAHTPEEQAKWEKEMKERDIEDAKKALQKNGYPLTPKNIKTVIKYWAKGYAHATMPWQELDNNVNASEDNAPKYNVGKMVKVVKGENEGKEGKVLEVDIYTEDEGWTSNMPVPYVYFINFEGANKDNVEDWIMEEDLMRVNKVESKDKKTIKESMPIEVEIEIYFESEFDDDYYLNKINQEFAGSTLDYNSWIRLDISGEGGMSVDEKKHMVSWNASVVSVNMNNYDDKQTVEEYIEDEIKGLIIEYYESWFGKTTPMIKKIKVSFAESAIELEASSNKNKKQSSKTLKDLVLDYAISLTYEARDAEEEEVLENFTNDISNSQNSDEIWDILAKYHMKDDFIEFTQDKNLIKKHIENNKKTSVNKVKLNDHIIKNGKEYMILNITPNWIFMQGFGTDEKLTMLPGDLYEGIEDGTIIMASEMEIKSLQDIDAFMENISDRLYKSTIKTTPHIINVAYILKNWEIDLTKAFKDGDKERVKRLCDKMERSVLEKEDNYLQLQKDWDNGLTKPIQKVNSKNNKYKNIDRDDVDENTEEYKRGLHYFLREYVMVAGKKEFVSSELGHKDYLITEMKIQKEKYPDHIFELSLYHRNQPDEVILTASEDNKNNDEFGEVNVKDVREWLKENNVKIYHVYLEGADWINGAVALTEYSEDMKGWYVLPNDYEGVEVVEVIGINEKDNSYKFGKTKEFNNKKKALEFIMKNVNSIKSCMNKMEVKRIKNKTEEKDNENEIESAKESEQKFDVNISNTDLRKLNDKYGYENGASIRLKKVKERLERKYNSKMNNGYIPGMTFEEYCEYNLSPRSPYGAEYDVELASMDFKEYEKDNKKVESAKQSEQKFERNDVVEIINGEHEGSIGIIEDAEYDENYWRDAGGEWVYTIEVVNPMNNIDDIKVYEETFETLYEIPQSDLKLVEENNKEIKSKTSTTTVYADMKEIIDFNTKTLKEWYVGKEIGRWDINNEFPSRIDKIIDIKKPDPTKYKQGTYIVVLQTNPTDEVELPRTYEMVMSEKELAKQAHNTGELKLSPVEKGDDWKLNTYASKISKEFKKLVSTIEAMEEGKIKSAAKIVNASKIEGAKTVNCTYEDIIKVAHGTYGTSQYASFTDLPNCIFEAMKEEEVEVESSSYTVGEPIAFIRSKLKTIDGAVLEFEYELGNVKSEDEGEGGTEEMQQYVAEEMADYFRAGEWGDMNVYFEVIEEPKEEGKQKAIKYTQNKNGVKASGEDKYYEIKLEHMNENEAIKTLKEAGFNKRYNGQYVNKENEDVAEIKYSPTRKIYRINFYDKGGKIMASEANNLTWVQFGDEVEASEIISKNINIKVIPDIHKNEIEERWIMVDEDLLHKYAYAVLDMINYTKKYGTTNINALRIMDEIRQGLHSALSGNISNNNKDLELASDESYYYADEILEQYLHTFGDFEPDLYEQQDLDKLETHLKKYIKADDFGAHTPDNPEEEVQSVKLTEDVVAIVDNEDENAQPVKVTIPKGSEIEVTGGVGTGEVYFIYEDKLYFMGDEDLNNKTTYEPIKFNGDDDFVRDFFGSAKELEVGDLAKVNINVVSKYDNSPLYLKLVRQMIKDSHGEVYVYNIDKERGVVEIASHKYAGINSIVVPIESLTFVKKDTMDIGASRTKDYNKIKVNQDMLAIEDETEIRETIPSGAVLRKTGGGDGSEVYFEYKGKLYSQTEEKMKRYTDYEQDPYVGSKQQKEDYAKLYMKANIDYKGDQKWKKGIEHNRNFWVTFTDTEGGTNMASQILLKTADEVKKFVEKNKENIRSVYVTPPHNDQTKYGGENLKYEEFLEKY